MKDAIATVEIFAEREGSGIDRLSLVVGSPERRSSGEGWQCRVALADFARPETLSGRDSFEALALALTRARVWIRELEAQGRVLTRDRAGKIPFELP